MKKSKTEIHEISEMIDQYNHDEWKGFTAKLNKILIYLDWLQTQIDKK